MVGHLRLLVEILARWHSVSLLVSNIDILDRERRIGQTSVVSIRQHSLRRLLRWRREQVLYLVHALLQVLPGVVQVLLALLLVCLMRLLDCQD